MMKNAVSAALISACLLGAAAVRFHARGDEEPGAPLDANAAFERLKSLAGEWQGTVFGHPATVRYRLVGAGSALVEEQFPGTEQEMLSVYHLDGTELVMTHYCAARNQPRLKLDRNASTPNDLRFAFDGGTNINPTRDLHVHETRLQLKDRDRIVAHWTAYNQGKPDHTATFELTRRR